MTYEKSWKSLPLPNTTHKLKKWPPNIAVKGWSSPFIFQREAVLVSYSHCIIAGPDSEATMKR